MFLTYLSRSIADLLPYFMTMMNFYVSGNRSFDDSAWGAAFDTNDDVDSVWGFNPASNKVRTKPPMNSFVLLQLSMVACWMSKFVA